MKNLKITSEAHNLLKEYCLKNHLKISDWVSNEIIKKIKPDLFVEISPRQTGKTTRLIKSIAEFLNENPTKSVVVVLPNNNSNKYFKDRLEQFKIDKDRVIVSNTMKHGYKNFVDEVDFINPKKLFLDVNGYYTTTLNSETGSDFTKNLYLKYLELNGKYN